MAIQPDGEEEVSLSPAIARCTMPITPVSPRVYSHQLWFVLMI